MNVLHACMYDVRGSTCRERLYGESFKVDHAVLLLLPCHIEYCHSCSTCFEGVFRMRPANTGNAS